MSLRARSMDSPERNRWIAARRKSGYTFVALAAALGISPTRVQQIVRNEASKAARRRHDRLARLIRAKLAANPVVDPGAPHALAAPMCDGTAPLSVLRNVVDCCGESSDKWVDLKPTEKNFDNPLRFYPFWLPRMTS